MQPMQYPHKLLCLFICMFSLFGFSSLCAQEYGAQETSASNTNAQNNSAQKLNTLDIGASEKTDDNDYLAAYLVNWDETSHQFASCNGQAGHHNNANQAHNESHFLLGDCPSVDSINLYYVSTALLHYTAAILLPKKYSRLLTDSTVNFQVSLFKEHSSVAMTMSF